MVKKSIVNRYNRIMYSICHEYSSVGEYLSENSSGVEENEGNCLWTLRDMVAECDYDLSTYYEVGHCNEEMRHLDAEDRKMWRNETAMLKRFIDRYGEEAMKEDEFERHCSKYDVPHSELTIRDRMLIEKGDNR